MKSHAKSSFAIHRPRSIGRLLVICTLLFALTGCNARLDPTVPGIVKASQVRVGKFVGVTSANAFVFESQLGDRFEIRLKGVGVAQTDILQNNTKLKLAELLRQRKSVTALTHVTDDGELIGNAHSGDVWINGELIRLGLAHHCSRDGFDIRLARLQGEAQIKQLEIWADQAHQHTVQLPRDLQKTAIR